MSTPDRPDLSDLRSRLSRPDRPDLPPLPDLTGLTHAYGDAADTVEHLRTLTLPPSQRRYRQLNLHLVSAVIHQETLYPVTVPVTEYLMDLAEADALTGPGRAVVRDYLGHLIDCVEQDGDSHGMVRQLFVEPWDAGSDSLASAEATMFTGQVYWTKDILDNSVPESGDPRPGSGWLSEDSDLGALLRPALMLVGIFGARDDQGALAQTEDLLRRGGIVATLREHPSEVERTLDILRGHGAGESVGLLEQLRDAAQPFLASPEKDPVDADLWALEDRYLFHTTDRAGVLKALSERK